jgi:hypothetical protein
VWERYALILYRQRSIGVSPVTAEHHFHLPILSSCDPWTGIESLPIVPDS